MASIKSSELITNEDGSIFHLHLLPEDLADDINLNLLFCLMISSRPSTDLI